MARRNTTTYGFAKTSGLLNAQIRKASESRGFAQSRLLTHWEEIVGADVAAIARPVEVSYGRKAFGATLTLLTTGANAPLLEMQKEQLRDKVNALYGYNAIARIRITQTASTGFAEGRVAFGHAQKVEKPEPSPEIKAEAHKVAGDIHDDGLRQALERLAGNVISKSRR
ncbi:DUF721 domain-containing protein [Salipiger sp. PrR002]|uniref:DUF721 domain-containing protein n=1 Tax=Salipiger sp. PrR002 TaxID=2706489 RepID=UPI0013BAA993|nr:DciA family protein [Salipiger sp. PrR002]NDW00776.1 DUF721 domain-containing protein [Salipiger sp. PrR002]NDW58445.1 DUF721 domain-containing protein [Salipiger sp. PrR004]